jgi:hypothetical protein
MQVKFHVPIQPSLYLRSSASERGATLSCGGRQSRSSSSSGARQDRRYTESSSKPPLHRMSKSSPTNLSISTESRPRRRQIMPSGLALTWRRNNAIFKLSASRSERNRETPRARPYRLWPSNAIPCSSHVSIDNGLRVAARSSGDTYPAPILFPAAAGGSSWRVAIE